MPELPLVIENIILDYKNDLEYYEEHKKRFKNTLRDIKNMCYYIRYDDCSFGCYVSRRYDKTGFCWTEYFYKHNILCYMNDIDGVFVEFDYFDENGKYTHRVFN